MGNQKGISLLIIGNSGVAGATPDPRHIILDAVPALLARGPLCVPVVFALLLALLNPYNVPCHTGDGD